MPWKAKDATRFTKKARTPKLKRMWQHIADRMLASGKSEGQAIAGASSVVKRRGK